MATKSTTLIAMINILTITLAIAIILLIITLILISAKFKKIESSLSYTEKRSSELDFKFDTAFTNQRIEINQNLQPIQEVLSNQLKEGKESNLELYKTINNQMAKIREENDKKLESIRTTVEEKLQVTLENKIGSSFSVVSKELTKVYEGLGEVHTLVTDVGDLKRVLQNVKSRGTWGEVQLDSLLNDMLTSNQYVKNLKFKSGKIVEFAIKIPSKDSNNSYIYLPIDSKFPKEDYENLNIALESGNKDLAERLNKQLITNIRNEAKKIGEKYINPPVTTDFAILYLPFESLYTQVLKTPGLIDELQNRYRITLSGPTTVTALLNSLQLGFKTLAIEQKTSEVWNILNSARTEFNKFEATIITLKGKSESLYKGFDELERRSRVLKSKLDKVDK